MTLSKRMGSFIICAVAAFGTAEVDALVMSGMKDQLAFVAWSVQFAVAVAGILSLITPTLVAHFHAVARYSLAIAIGGVFGVLWTLVVATLLGPWFGAFSIPVVVCWVSGGMVAAIVADLSWSELHRRFAWVILVCVGTSVAANLTVRTYVAQASKQQRLTVVTIRYTPGDNPVVYKNPDKLRVLSGDELAALKTILKTGTLVPDEGGIEVGTGPKSKAVIVLTGPVGASVTLPQPDTSTVFFIQGSNGWSQYPSSARTLNRRIFLDDAYWKDGDGRSRISTRASVERPQGAQGGRGTDWPAAVQPKAPVTSPIGVP